jgi:beta-glucosidase
MFRVATISAAILSVSAATARAQGPATVTPVPRQGHPMQMHQKFLDRTEKGDVDLLFLGDSITQGWNNNKVWQRHYGPRKAANYGIGGDRTQHVLWRIQNGEIDGISPKLIVLMIGTNNAGSDSAEDIAAGIKAIVKTLREKLPETKILLLGVFPRGEKPNPLREKLDRVNATVSKLDDKPYVTYLDIGKSFLEPDGTLSRTIMPDFLHLSGRGYRIWADAIEPTVWELLDEPKRQAD